MTQKRHTDSGIEIDAVIGQEDVTVDPERDIGRPGEWPFTRGVYPRMYRDRLWTMRQYAGFGGAEATNQRFRYLLSAGQTGLSVAFDLPTQMGYDSDHPKAVAEVGRVGVAVDSLADMELLFEGIPLGQVSTSMTINATAAILLLLYELVAEQQGVPLDQVTGTVQNDILKEYTARGTYIYPPKASMRIVTDLFAYCRERLPRFNTISVSGYHIREAGATAVQEVAFTIADGIAYVEAALEAGLDVDEFGPRLSFFFACHMNFFEEVAKFRAARRLWARVMKERFAPQNPRSMMLRFHAQTGGSTLTAQQPENNIVRTTLEGLAAVLGGTQSLHTNSFDEALTIPTEKAATIALRTQQILAYESSVTDTVDPLAGSWFVESLTSQIEERAREYIEKIDAMGGATKAIESGWMKDEIEEAAYKIAKDIEAGNRVVVGLNKYSSEVDPPVKLHQVDPELQRLQIKRLNEVKEGRDQAAVSAALEEVEETARDKGNLMYPMREALAAYATLGEVADALRNTLGQYEPRGI